MIRICDCAQRELPPIHISTKETVKAVRFKRKCECLHVGLRRLMSQGSDKVYVPVAFPRSHYRLEELIVAGENLKVKKTAPTVAGKSGEWR